MSISLKEYLRGPNGAYTRVWIGLALVVLVALLWFVNYLMHDTRSEWIAQDLEREFELVQPLPEASLIEHYAKVDSEVVYVENTYESSVSNEAIQNYYDLELTNHGWTKCGAAHERERNTQRNVITSTYCKRFYKMILVYYEDETALRRQFWLRLNRS